MYKQISWTQTLSNYKRWKIRKMNLSLLLYSDANISVFYSYFIYLFIYFWLCWVFGSCEGLLRLRQVGATLHRGAGTALHRGARAFHYRGPSRCGAQAPDAQAQQLWPTGPAAPRHVGSSQTRARTRVPCISRHTPNHWATREALSILIAKKEVRTSKLISSIECNRYHMS